MKTTLRANALLLAGLLCLGCATRSLADGGSLVVNGSFEIRKAGEPNKHVDPLTPERDDLVGWRVTGRSVDWIGPTRWKASHGEHCLDIDAPGGVEQTIATTPGVVYSLQFDMAGNVETEPSRKTLRVAVDGDTREFSFDAAGHTRQDLGWVRKDVHFTARGAKTTLAFSNASEKPTASGVALDNVVVVECKPGRFTVRPSDRGLILVDAATGATWMLSAYQGKSAWLPVEMSEPTERLRQLGAKVTLKDGVLREVDLTGSALTDADMAMLAPLNSLERITLNGCRQLTDAGLVHLKPLGKLKGLGLESTRITDAGLAHLEGLSDLEILSVNGTHIGDAGLKHLGRLNRLAVLYLAGTSTGDEGLRSLKTLSALQWLDLSGTRVTDAGVPHLAGLGRLRLLSLRETAVGDAGAASLTELPSLEVLTLSRTALTDAGLAMLKKSPKLIDLDVAETRVTQAGVDALKRALPKCKTSFGGEPPAAGPMQKLELR